MVTDLGIIIYEKKYFGFREKIKSCALTSLYSFLNEGLLGQKVVQINQKTYQNNEKITHTILFFMPHANVCTR